VKYRISKILVIFLLISPRFVLGGSLPWKQEGKDFLSGTTLDVVFNSEGNITLPPPARPNLIPNGSFENGSGVDAENWTEGTGYTRDSTYAHSGGWAMKFVSSGPGPWACNNSSVSVTVGHTYRLSAWFYVTEHSAGSWTFLDLNDVSGDPEIYANTIGSWHYVSNTWVATTGSVNPRIAAHAGTGIISWVDDVRFEDLNSAEVPYTCGIYTSQGYECDTPTTFGTISWVADIPEGCSITLLTSTASTLSGLGATFETSTTTTSGTGEAEIMSPPNKCIQFRAILRSSGVATPVLKKVVIKPAVKAISTSPSFMPVIKPKDIPNFRIYFNIPMSTADTPVITIVPQTGTPVTLPPAGTWEDSKTFVTANNTQTLAGAGGGYATVNISGAKTATNGFDLYHSFPGFILIDSEEIVSLEKLSFFPDPFSPNGDGRNDNTKLSFSAGSEPVDVSCRIYDLKGRLIKTIYEQQGVMGNQIASWDGTDENNKICPVGIYLFQLKKGTQTQNGTVVLTK